MFWLLENCTTCQIVFKLQQCANMFVIWEYHTLQSDSLHQHSGVTADKTCSPSPPFTCTSHAQLYVWPARLLISWILTPTLQSSMSISLILFPVYLQSPKLHLVGRLTAFRSSAVRTATSDIGAGFWEHVAELLRRTLLLLWFPLCSWWLLLASIKYMCLLAGGRSHSGLVANNAITYFQRPQALGC